MRKKNVVLQQVLVSDYAAEGKAISRIDGKVVFIEGAVPGDVVDVQLSKNKKNGARAGLSVFTLIAMTAWTRFAGILASAAAANGRCCLMKSNCSISSMKWNKIFGASGK